MEQFLYWLIPLALIVLMMWALIHENSARRRRTVQEFERDVANAKQSLMRAGMLELDKFVGESRSKQAAVEYLKDEEQGMTKTGGNDDDADRTASDSPR
ncbi:MAG: hypothetical protein WAU45_04220 [Blastocatellia bacterium]